MTQELVRLMPVELCGRDPISVRDLANELGGDELSGHQRVIMLQEVRDALLHFYEVAREYVETDEQAAALVLRMVARDPNFEVPEWARELFAAHREGLEELFHDPGRGRATDYGSDRTTSSAGEDESAKEVARMGVRVADLPADTLDRVAELFVAGKVEDAAQLARVPAQRLFQWAACVMRFQCACGRASIRARKEAQRQARTRRDAAAAALAAEGLTYAEIAREIGADPRTVKKALDAFIGAEKNASQTSADQLAAE